MQAVQQSQAEKIVVGRRVRFVGGYGNIDGEGLIVAVHGKPNPEPAQTFGGVMRVIRPNDCQVEVILFDGRKLGSVLQCSIDKPGIGIKLLDRIHGPELIEVAKRKAAEKIVSDKLKAEAEKAAFEKAEANRVIEHAPIFYWNGIKDAKGAELQKCCYSKGPLYSNPDPEVITIYAKNYRRFSALVRTCFVVENDSDSMTDYFCNDTIRVIPAHPLYAKVKAAFDAQQAHGAKRAAKRAGGAA